MNELIHKLQTIKTLEESAAQLTQQLNQRQQELDSVKRELDSQKQESESYLMEIDEISKELESTQEQNGRLIEQSADKDSTSQRLMKEVCIHHIITIIYWNTHIKWFSVLT